MGEPMYLFLQHCDVYVADAAGGSTALPPPPAAPSECQHNFQRDRDDLDAIKADIVASEHDYAEIMDRVERWNRVHNRPAVPPRRDTGGAAPMGVSYAAPPPGYDGRSTGSASSGRSNMPPPYPSAGGGGTPSPYPSQPPPQYPPTYPPAYTASTGGGAGPMAGGGGGGGGAPPPYSAAMSGGWTCSNCTYQVQPHESQTVCPICASPRG